MGRDRESESKYGAMAQSAHAAVAHLDHGRHELGQESRDEKKARPDLMHQVDDESLGERSVVILNTVQINCYVRAAAPTSYQPDEGNKGWRRT